MPHFICTVCGTQYEASDTPPERCAICADARQYEARRSPQWTTHDELTSSHRNTVQQLGPDLVGIGIEPSFAIGQRAILLLHPEGNVLWDCVPLLDAGLARLIEAAGGLSAIAISHPHYYSSMAVWSEAFGGVPVYLHEDDRAWVMRDDANLHFWSGERHALRPGLALIRCGGHFAGGTVLHCDEGAGSLLSGDVIQVVPDTRFVSFMYSYPNLIPLSEAEVDRIVNAVADYDFERIYGAFWGMVVRSEGKERLEASAERYRDALRGEHGPASSLAAPRTSS